MRLSNHNKFKELGDALIRSMLLCFLLATASCSRVPPEKPGPNSRDYDPEPGLGAIVENVVTGPKIAMQSTTRNGVTIEFSLTPVGPGTNMQEGDDALFRFKVSDINGAAI